MNINKLEKKKSLDEYELKKKNNLRNQFLPIIHNIRSNVLQSFIHLNLLQGKQGFESQKQEFSKKSF